MLQVAMMCQAVDCRIPSQERHQEILNSEKTFASQKFMCNCDPSFEPVNTNQQTTFPDCFGFIQRLFLFKGTIFFFWNHFYFLSPAMDQDIRLIETRLKGTLNYRSHDELQ